MTRNEKLVKERIAKDLAQHVITERHAHGLYRHYRCQRPGSWNMGFDVVTWPGSLCFTGDMGEYLFQRTDDMIAFMRGSCMSYSYAAEKCVAHDGRLMEFSEDAMERLLAMAVVDAESEDMNDVLEKCDEIRNVFANNSDHHATRQAMYDSDLWDGSDFPSCEEYTFHFLWCLHAMKWFCENVELAVKAPAAVITPLEPEEVDAANAACLQPGEMEGR